MSINSPCDLMSWRKFLSQTLSCSHTWVNSSLSSCLHSHMLWTQYDTISHHHPTCVCLPAECRTHNLLFLAHWSNTEDSCKTLPYCLGNHQQSDCFIHPRSCWHAILHKDSILTPFWNYWSGLQVTSRRLHPLGHDLFWWAASLSASIWSYWFISQSSSWSHCHTNHLAILTFPMGFKAKLSCDPQPPLRLTKNKHGLLQCQGLIC